MSETLALSGRQVAAIHLEDWFHPSDTSLPITVLDEPTCDYLAVRWREPRAGRFGCSECDNRVDDSGPCVTPVSRIRQDAFHLLRPPREDATRLSAPRADLVRFPLESRLRANLDGLRRDLASLLRRFRRRVRATLFAAG